MKDLKLTIPLITPDAKENLKQELRLRHQKDRGHNQPPIALARGMMQASIDGLSKVLQQEDSLVRLGVETDITRNLPTNVTGGAGIVRGLIIFDGIETFTVAATVSPSLITLNCKKTFLDHPDAAPMLLDAIVGEVESVIQAAQSKEAELSSVRHHD